jgi:hypothetical protein
MEVKKQDNVKEIIDYTITKVLDAIKRTYLGTVNQAVFRTLNDDMFIMRVADELYDMCFQEKMQVVEIYYKGKPLDRMEYKHFFEHLLHAAFQRFLHS